jgi:hypothetical protein
MPPHPVFIGRDAFPLTFCPGWPWTTILPTSDFWVVRIIGISHHARLFLPFICSIDQINCVVLLPTAVLLPVLVLKIFTACSDKFSLSVF